MLPTLVREYLLCGHLIDRAGMPHLISEFGRETMTAIAIDEWMGGEPRLLEADPAGARLRG